MSLQPSARSFDSYVIIGIEYVLKRKLNKREILLIRKLRLIDDSVLILDDILDGSKTRNGKPCLYLSKGIPLSIIHAELNKSKALLSLQSIMSIFKTKPDYQKQVYETMHAFLNSIYLGEQLDYELENSTLSTNIKLHKYFKMVRLFTGGHIRYALEVGQLIANKNPNPNISKIAESAGIIRQIVDDFKDYFKEHHEPFGDFLSKSNRLPEILYYKHKGKYQKAYNLLKNRKHEQARKLILNSNVRKDMYAYCEKETKIIMRTKTNFDYSRISIDFKGIQE